MSQNYTEIEVKFYINDLPALETSLQAAGASLAEERTFELNLRFDTPSGELTSARRVLRLRKDRTAWLTYKGPRRPGEDVGIRTEIEFEVSSFDSARTFLEALGYEVNIVYEKYRTTYKLGTVLVMLDELPYGSFVEIEGPDAATIQQAAQQLELDWSARCPLSYLELFSRLRLKLWLQARYLTFSELKDIHFSANDFDLIAADAAKSH
jgi:adenylate cyclase class 2